MAMAGDGKSVRHGCFHFVLSQNKVSRKHLSHSEMQDVVPNLC